MKINIGLIFFTIALLVSSNIFAIPQNILTKAIEINYDKNETFYIEQANAANQTAALTPPKGQTEQYFLIRSGIKIAGSELRRSNTFFGAIPERSSGCTTENLYGLSFPPGNNLITAKEKKRLFNTCMKFKVEDPKKGKLIYEPKQENCVIEKIDDYTALISTGDCFFKAVPDQILYVTLNPDSKCNDKTFLAQNNFSPSEIQAEWTSYLYPAKEIGVIFRPIGEAQWMRKLFINLNAGEDLLKIVETTVDEQTIYRPQVFPFPDFLLSDITINNLQNTPGSYATLSFLINNYGAKGICEAGICSNYENYDIPFAPFLTLYEIDPKKSKKIEISSFYMGDRIPGRWNGIFSQRIAFKNYLFEVGKKYSIELTFFDPANSYEELKKTYKSLLGLGGNPIGGLGRNSIGTLPTIRRLSGLGSISTFSGLGSGGIFIDIPEFADNQIPRIIDTMDDPTFPPEYSMVCNKGNSFCQKSGIKEHEKLIINFEVKDIAPNKKVDFGSTVEVKLSGKLLPEFSSTLDLNKKPSINCGGIL